MQSIIFFILGATVGSFLNVLIYRLWENEEVVVTRSHCRFCRHVLAWDELIPIFSFLFLRGKCKNCRESISWQYPIVEFSNGLLFVFASQKVLGCSLAVCTPHLAEVILLGLYLAIMSLCTAMFVFDLKHYVLPNVFLYSAIGFVVMLFLFQPSTALAGLFGAFSSSAFIAALVVMTKERGMGQGDIYLSFALGGLVGWPYVIPAMFLSFFSGAVAGIFLLVLKRKTMKSPLPFGPFLIASFLAVFFIEPDFIVWYLSLFAI